MSQMREPTPGTLPAEGRDDLPTPGADRGIDVPGTPEPPDEGLGPESPSGVDRRDDLAERVGDGPPAAGGGQSDLLPGIDVPAERM